MSSPFADVSKVYPLENLSAHLRSFGIHPTAKRLLIARQMLSRHGHYCADEVYACLVQEKSAVSRATVYNTLKVFVEHGLLRELVVDASRTFYDSNISPHPHLYNVDTGKFSDLKSDDIDLCLDSCIPEDTQVEAIDVIIRVRQNGSRRTAVS